MDKCKIVLRACESPVYSRRLAPPQIRDSLVRLTATIEILMYIYKNRGFPPYNMGRVYKDVVRRRRTIRIVCLALFSLRLPFFSLFFRFLFLFCHSRITHTYIGTTHSFAFTLNVEGSRLHTYLLFIVPLYGKSRKNYWFSFFICASLFFLSFFHSFSFYPLSESLLSFVSALLVRCGSALLINLTLAMSSRYVLVIFVLFVCDRDQTADRAECR